MAMKDRKKDFNYFDYFCNCADIICEAANYLDASIEGFDHASFQGRVDIMHEIEHRADSVRHDMTHHLLHEFITPIEREDIIDLAQQLDNVVDALEDTMRRMYMFDIKDIRPEALVFSKLIVKCCGALQDVMKEFRNFKSSKTIRDQIVLVNTLESEGDTMHAEYFHALYSSNADTRTLLIWTNLLEDFEMCLDACEDVVDIIESVIMKNT